MEKRLLLFLALTFGIILVYYQVFPPPAPPKKSEESATETVPANPPEEGRTPPEEPGKPAEPVPPPTPEPGTPEAVEPPDEGERLPKTVAAGMGTATEIDTPLVRWSVDTWGGTIRSALLKRFARLPDQDLSDPGNWYPVLMDLVSPDVFSGGATPYRTRSLSVDVLNADDEVVLPLSRMLWELAEKGTDRVVFRLAVPPAGVVLEKEILFPSEAEGVEGGAYHASLTLRMRVTDREKAAKYGAAGWRIRLTGPGGLPAEPNTPGGMRTTAAVLTSDVVDPEEHHAPGKSDDPIRYWPEPENQSEKRLVEWAGLHSRFFSSILKPDHPDRVGARRAAIVPEADLDSKSKPVANLSVALDFLLPFPKDGESVTRSFLLYAGPMDPDVFEAPAYATFGGIIDYGWFGFIAKILVFLLGVIRSVVGNWGIAIIILTLLVRISMFPLSRKTQMSMQRYQKQMGRLKPKMDVIKERHGKNKKKMNEEMMKLYREEGVRMFPAGCLVMFLQLPIFIGLFQALRYSIGLRHSAFLWAKDLTAPDQLAGPFRTGNIPLLPDPFSLNLLPILMGITWWLSTKMTPKPADPNQAQTMKMMQFMPIIFSLLLYSYPAGLALYMVISSTWSIFETKVVKKLLFKEEQGQLAAAPAFRKGK